MDLRNIQTFIRVTELGSFTKAAGELGYVQSAVTMQIKQLERELGFPLFDRMGKKVSLTAAGAEFINYAYEIVRSMQEAMSLGKDITRMHGTLRIGILESLLFSNLLPLLPEFKSTYKNLDLRVKIGQASDLLLQLKQNQLDMVYLSAKPNADPDFRCYYQRKEQLIFVSDPGHEAAGRTSISVKELLAYDFIVTERSGVCYGRLQELAQQHDAVLRTSIEVDSTVAIAALLQSNSALAFLPEYSVRRQLEEGQLVKVDVDLAPQVYYSQILVHRNRWLSPFIEKVIEEIRKAYPDGQ